MSPSHGTFETFWASCVLQQTAEHRNFGRCPARRLFPLGAVDKAEIVRPCVTIAPLLLSWLTSDRILRFR